MTSSDMDGLWNNTSGHRLGKNPHNKHISSQYNLRLFCVSKCVPSDIFFVIMIIFVCSVPNLVVYVYILESFVSFFAPFLGTLIWSVFVSICVSNGSFGRSLCSFGLLCVLFWTLCPYLLPFCLSVCPVHGPSSYSSSFTPLLFYKSYHLAQDQTPYETLGHLSLCLVN